MKYQRLDRRLGQDPELPPDRQDLREVRWFPLDAVAHLPEVARVLPALRGA